MWESDIIWRYINNQGTKLIQTALLYCFFQLGWLMDCLSLSAWLKAVGQLISCLDWFSAFPSILYCASKSLGFLIYIMRIMRSVLVPLIWQWLFFHLCGIVIYRPTEQYLLAVYCFPVCMWRNLHTENWRLNLLKSCCILIKLLNQHSSVFSSFCSLTD